MAKVAKDMGETLVNALASAAIAGGASFFFLPDSKYNDDFWGLTSLPGYQINAIMSAGGSVAGDILGKYGIPMLADKVINNDMLTNLLENGLPSTIAGGTFVLLKKVGSDSTQSMGKDFLVGAGSDLVARQLVSAFF